MTWSFCKTRADPYDVVVTATLLVLQTHLGPERLIIESDGEFDGPAWDPGRALYEAALERAVPVAAG